MPRPRLPRAVLALAVPVLLAGCATHDVAPTTAVAPDGMTMSVDPATGPAGPPDTALMVCGDDITADVQQVLDLPAPPPTRSTWDAPVFTCTYTLPQGPMTLSVQVLPNDAAAATALDAGQAATPGAAPLPGLGERAWGSPAGTAVVLKDAQILTVDTTGLPEVFGANDQKRTDLAYEIASDVLGCWTGDGDE